MYLSPASTASMATSFSSLSVILLCLWQGEALRIEANRRLGAFLVSTLEKSLTKTETERVERPTIVFF